MKIPISAIENHNERDIQDSDEDLAELTNSMSNHGLLSPILLREHPTKQGRYLVVFGGRRLLAGKKLGWKFIDARIVSISDYDSIVMFLTENLDRKDLTDYEKGLALKKLHDLSRKPYLEIAANIGKSVSYVSLHVAMTELFPSSIATPAERSKVLLRLSERHARALSTIDDPLERWNTAKLSIGAGLGVRELERIVRRFHDKEDKPASNPQNRSIADVIAKVVIGLNSLDVRPLFDSVSPEDFTLFSRFPPFSMMNIEEAKNHVVDVLSKLDEFHYKITDMQIHNTGNFAYVTLQVLHEIGLEGRKISTKSRATIVLQKKNHCWKIIHEHWSTANPEEQTWKLPSFSMKRHVYEESFVQYMR